MTVAEKIVNTINVNNFNDNREILIEDHQNISFSTSYCSAKKPRLSNFDYSLESLKSLQIPDCDLEDEEIAVASKYAFERAYSLFMKLYDFFGPDFLYCSSTLESRGGINLVWNNQSLDKKIWVRIPFSSSLKSSIYCQEGEESIFIEGLSSETMMKLLLWLKNNRRNVLKDVL
jgi:hypothetical protein